MELVRNNIQNICQNMFIRESYVQELVQILI